MTPLRVLAISKEPRQTELFSKAELTFYRPPRSSYSSLASLFVSSNTGKRQDCWNTTLLRHDLSPQLIGNVDLSNLSAVARTSCTFVAMAGVFEIASALRSDEQLDKKLMSDGKEEHNE